MQNCGALLTRTGHFNGSNTIVLANKGMNMRRNVTTFVRNKFLASQLLRLPACSLLETRNGVNNSCLLTSHIIVKSMSSVYTRTLHPRNIYAHVQIQQCSTLTSGVEKDNMRIPKNEILDEEELENRELTRSFKMKNIFEEDPEEMGHRTHGRKELKIPEIETLYPSAKSVVHNVYVSVQSQLKIFNPMVIEVSQQRGQKNVWQSTYTVKWPEEAQFTATAVNKTGAIKVGALKVLQWLHNTGKIKNGRPVIYSSKAIIDMLKKPTPISVKEDTLNHVTNLLNRYNSEIKGMIQNSTDSEHIRHLSLEASNESYDPVGHSDAEQWNSEYISRRNHILRDRLEFKTDNKTSLPISEYKDKIIHEIENNRALLIKGDTGCGKTTQVPSYIMDSFAARGQAADCNMIVSQPRRISAISLAERMAEERDERVGDVVGFQVRLQQNLPQTPGGILFCTTGILLRKLQVNPFLKGVSHIILDEAHERSINTDMLLVLLKRALEKNAKLKVIVMSATINADLFQRYFDCGVIDVPGRTFPVEMNFLDDIEALGMRSRREFIGDKLFPETPFVDCEQIGDLISWISKNKPPGAILCFLPGWAEIVKVKTYLEENSQGQKHFIVPVHSRMRNQDQKKIFERPPSGIRKIVLATDVAETGITVTDVVYVVDSATRRCMRWHDKKGVSSMDNQYASQANILQRKGRAGRVGPGKSYHFVTEAHFNNLPIHPLPEVLCTSLEQTVLDCKTYSNEKAESFLSSMPQPPALSTVRKAVLDLAEIGALDEEENLTALGKRIALFTMHPKLSKAMVYSSIFQCVSPINTIASVMSAENEIFSGTLYNKEAIRKIKVDYHPTSDHVSIGWLYAQWAQIFHRGRQATDEFCWQSKLMPDRVLTLSKVRNLNAQSLIKCRMLDENVDYDDRNNHNNAYSTVDELVRGVLLSGVDQLLHHRDFELTKNKVKKGASVFVMEDGMRATVTPESVNFKRKSWPSPFLTYVRKQHSEERRTSLIRETSMIAPVTALLFTQGRIKSYRPNPSEMGDAPANHIGLTIKGRDNFRLSCDPNVAITLLHFRDMIWDVVRYFVNKHGLVDEVSNSDYSNVVEFKDSMLQVIVQMLTEAAAKIDDPDSKRKNKSSPFDDDEDDYSDDDMK